LSSEYESETESNTELVLSAQEQSLPTLPPLTPLSPSPPPSYTMNQHDLNTIIRQQQEQLVAMQMQIQALLAGEEVAGRMAGGGAASIECYSTRVWTDFGLGLGLGP